MKTFAIYAQNFDDRSFLRLQQCFMDLWNENLLMEIKCKKFFIFSKPKTAPPKELYTAQ